MSLPETIPTICGCQDHEIKIANALASAANKVSKAQKASSVAQEAAMDAALELKAAQEEFNSIWAALKSQNIGLNVEAKTNFFVSAKSNEEALTPISDTGSKTKNAENEAAQAETNTDDLHSDSVAAQAKSDTEHLTTANEVAQAGTEATDSVAAQAKTDTELLTAGNEVAQADTEATNSVATTETAYSPAAEVRESDDTGAASESANEGWKSAGSKCVPKKVTVCVVKTAHSVPLLVIVGSCDDLSNKFNIQYESFKLKIKKKPDLNRPILISFKDIFGKLFYNISYQEFFEMKGEYFLKDGNWVSKQMLNAQKSLREANEKYNDFMRENWDKDTTDDTDRQKFEDKVSKFQEDVNILEKDANFVNVRFKEAQSDGTF